MSITDRRSETAEGGATTIDRPIPVTRRRIDQLLIGAGLVAALVMAVAGGLLTWGSSFAADYVDRELSAQNITFPPAEVLAEEGRDDIVDHGGEVVNTGEEAEAYASFIAGHVENTAGGMTYAEIPDREAQAAVEQAREAGASEEEIAELENEAQLLTQQRDTVFKGEMLRGVLLNAYAWSTMGQIAGIAAVVAFAGAVLMVVLSVAGLFHLRKASH